MQSDLVVLQVVPSYYPATVYGGPIFSIHSMCEHVARLGVEVRVSTTNVNGTSTLPVDDGKRVALSSKYSVRYYKATLGERFSWAFVKNVHRDIEEAQVIHVQDIFSIYASWALMLSWKARRPTLISPRGVFSKWALAQKPLVKRAWLEYLVRPWCRDRERVVFHATSESEMLDIKSLFPQHRVYVIPNGIDCAQYESVKQPDRNTYLRKFWPSCPVEAEKVKIAVTLGRLHRVKGLDIAIAALQRLKLAGVSVVLLVAGPDAGDLERLRIAAKTYKVEEAVRFLGPIGGGEKIEFLKGADVFLLPSHSENFALACAEALAAGVPVVASKGTPWKSLELTGAGRWVENEAEAFARAIEDLLARPQTEVREKAKALAREFDVGRLACRFVNLYREMCDGRRE